MDYTQLAWSLAEACRHSLSETEKCVVYVALGAGDTRTAINELVRAAAWEHIALSPEVAVALRSWWAAYDDACGARNFNRVLIELLSTPSAPMPTWVAPRIRIVQKYLQPNRTRMSTA